MKQAMTKNLEQLKIKDLYSILLFVLYKLKDDNKYSTLSELAYLLDKDSLLKLCQYYGGMTITIPTIEDLDKVLNGMLVYQKVDLEHQNLKEVLSNFSRAAHERDEVLETYLVVKSVISGYNISEKVEQNS